MFKNMNTERASYFTERSYTTSEAENKKDIFEYWKKILGEDTLRVAEKCYGIDLVKVLNSENYVCENNHVMSEMEKVKIELFEKPINYNYSGFKGEKLAFDNFFIPLINYGIDILKNGTSLFLTDSIIDTYANTLLERLGKISLGILMFEMYLCKKTGKLNGRNSEEEYDYYNNNFLSKKSYKQELYDANGLHLSYRHNSCRNERKYLEDNLRRYHALMEANPSELEQYNEMEIH